MPLFTVYFSKGGKKMKAKVKAPNKAAAEKAVKEQSNG
jgi:hypothetical protein